MNITNNENTKMIILRKQINKIMNLNALKNFEKLPNLDTIISLYSSKKSYISPKQKFLIINKNKKIKRKISSKNQKPDKNSQKQNNELNNKNKNNKEIPYINNKENKNERKEIKKYNYKKKIILNKQKLNKNKNKDNNNLLLGSLMDDNEGMFDSNSLEKMNTNKLKNYVSNKINEKEKSKNLGNNIFDMGSISHISKNGSSSAKEKIGEEEIKNNNPFEKIVCDFIEEENCKNLFQENNNENDNNENPINVPYKSKAINEILKIENNNTNKEEVLLINEEKENDEIYKKIISKFTNDIMLESKSEVILVEKFVEDIFKESLSKNRNKNLINEKSKNEVILVNKFADDILIETISKNFVKILFDEIMKKFKARKENSINTRINIPINISKNTNENNNNKIDILKYKKISDEINKNEEIYTENKNSVNNSGLKPSFHSSEKKDNNLLKSQETKNIDSVYKRIASLPNISNSFRFGFLKRNSIRREYQQRRYRTLNSDNFD